MQKNAQFLIAGVLVLYIVFATRPAPRMVASLLASPIAQLAALAGVVYVGSSVSLLVAVLAALAVVLSIPAREYAGKDDDKTMTKKKETDTDSAADVKDAVQSLMKTAGKKAPPAPLPTGSKSEKTSEKKDGKKEEPEAAASKMVSTEGGSGSEKFSLRDAAPF
jgi:hypothetical protein